MTASHADRDSVVREVEQVAPEPIRGAAPADELAAVLALQRASGNQAVSRYLAGKRGLIGTGELASRWNRARAEKPMHPRRPEVCFRLPNAATITAMLASKEVPEDKLKASIQLALERMAKEGELKTQDPIPAVMSRLFPGPGTFDEKEFANVVDVADRSKIYEKASDAESKLSAKDQAKVEAAMDEAKKLIDRASKDAVNLDRVFGTKAGEAKTVYESASTAIVNLKANVATHVETDYNLDAMQTGMGGYALFTKQLVHLNSQVVGSMDQNDLVITLVHECSHLADKTVKDKGYYESANWDALDDDVKVTNAAHYEEIPRRYLKKSVYADDREFKPGTSASGNAVTFESEVRRMVEEYGRTCHASAQEIHVRLRQIHVQLQRGDRQAFDANEPLILEISKVFKLTIHDRAQPRSITTLDLSLSEGVAHAAWKFKAVAKAQMFPTQPDPGKDAKDHARKVLAAALKAYGTVTGNESDDRKLFAWLFTNKNKIKV